MFELYEKHDPLPDCDCVACAIAARDKLRAFARDVMRAWPEGDVDCGELQEAALRHGLLEPAEPTQEERDEWGLCDSDLWYRRTLLLAPNDMVSGGCKPSA